MYSKLQYISQGENQHEQLAHIQRVLDMGCDWIQLRFKNATEKEFTETAEKVQILCQPYQATFIVNDSVAVAKHVNAHGVHLGLTDTSVTEARKILGAEKIIGGTANTLQDVLQRFQENCDYIGLGPFKFTATKQKLSPILGLDGYKKIVDELKNHPKQIPIYAIGGIENQDIIPILQTGIYGIAVSGLLTKAENQTEIHTQLNAIV